MKIREVYTVKVTSNTLEKIFEVSCSYLDYKYTTPCSSFFPLEFPLHRPIPAVSLSPPLSITSDFLSLSWLHAVLVINDCLLCFPSLLSYEGCNFVTLAQFCTSNHWLHIISHQQEMQREAHFLSRFHTWSGGEGGGRGVVSTLTFILSPWTFFLQIHGLPMKNESEAVLQPFACLERGFYSIWSLQRWRIASYPALQCLDIILGPNKSWTVRTNNKLEELYLHSLLLSSRYRLCQECVCAYRCIILGAKPVLLCGTRWVCIVSHYESREPCFCNHSHDFFPLPQQILFLAKILTKDYFKYKACELC